MTARRTIHLAPNDQRELWAHLLGNPDGEEEAAFGFAVVERNGTQLQFRVQSWYAVQPADYAYRGVEGIELTDACRAAVIKRAHDLNAALIEFHSHPGSLPATFSITDRAGFEDFVPHVWWRLKGRPYAAVVVATRSADALAWVEAPDQSVRVDGIIAGDTFLALTQASITYYRGGSYGRKV